MSLVITIIIAGALALLALLGAWRGVQRGALALGATLLGVALSDLWGARLGEWLVTQFEAESAGATGMMSALLLLITALIGGYGGGILLTRAPKIAHWSKRMSGAILGLLNATIVVGYLLRFASESNPNTADLIANSQAAQVIHDGIPGFFLAAVSTITLFLIGTQIARTVRARQTIPQALPPMSRPVMPGPPASSAGIPPSAARREAAPTTLDKQTLDKLSEKPREVDRKP